MDLFWKDLRQGARQLIQKPALPVLAIITLALGIGANTAVFSIVHGVLLQPLPFPDAGELVRIWETHPKYGTMSVTTLNVVDWRQQNRSFENLAEYACGRTAVTGDVEPLRVRVCGVGRDFFSVFGVPPLAGRDFPPEALEFDGTPAVVISHGFWQRHLGGSPDFAESTVEIYGRTMPVVGVMPSTFDFPEHTEVWFANNIFSRPPPETRSGHNYSVVGRVRDGVSIAQADAEIDALQKRLSEEHPEADAAGAKALLLHETLVAPARRALLVLFGAAGLILLLACANVANLLLARAMDRRQEFAVRIALGAGPLRLLRQLMVESLLLAATGGLAGVLLARGIVAALPLFSPDDLPRLAEISLDWTVLAVACGVSFLTALIIGLAPAIQAVRQSPNTTLRQGGRSDAAGMRGNRVRSVLVVAEVTLAVILLIGAGLLTVSLWRVMSIDPGFKPDRLLAMQVELPPTRYPTAAERSPFFTALEQRAAAAAGVEQAGWISHVPMYGFTPSGRIVFADRPHVEDEWGHADYRIVSTNYFKTMGIPLREGRLFETSDRRDGVHVLVVNETFARRYYPGKSAVGERVQVAGFEPGQGELPEWLTIVGVVGDVRQRGLDREIRAETYVPHTQRAGFTGWSMNLVVRARGDAADPVAVLRHEVRELDAGLPVTFRTLDTILSDSYSDRRFQSQLVGSFALIGLLLAAIGIYGVIANSVSRRTGEFGIRMSLGAVPATILTLVLRQGLWLAGVGVVLGVAGALALTRLMSGMLFGVGAYDPLTFVGVLLAVLGVALLACVIPARRAARVDPLVALRYE